LVPLAVFGVFATWPSRSRFTVVYALILAYAASVVLFYVFARYRYPLVPMLVIVAAAGLVNASGWWETARPELVEGRARGSTGSPRAILCLGTVAVAAVAANWPLVPT